MWESIKPLLEQYFKLLINFLHMVIDFDFDFGFEDEEDTTAAG